MIEKFQSVFNWWDEHIQPWIDTGRDIVQGLWDGIKETWKRFTDWTATTWQAWVDRFKNFFGIHSPSTLFADFGESMMQGLQGGISAQAKIVDDAVSAVANNITSKMNSAVNVVKTAAGQVYAAFPNMTTAPGVSAGQLSGSNAPAAGGVITSIPATMSAFAAEMLKFNESLARSALVKTVGLADANTALTDLFRFAQQATQLLNAPGQEGISGTGSAAVGTLTTDTGGQQTGAILNAVYALITELRQKGLGNNFQLNLAPGDSADSHLDLRNIVEYLSAVYS